MRNKDTSTQDGQLIKFIDFFGYRPAKPGSDWKVIPGIHVEGTEAKWSMYQPTEDDYKDLAENVQLMVDLYL